jgi:hypothetical protein
VIVGHPRGAERHDRPAKLEEEDNADGQSCRDIKLLTSEARNG